MQFRPIHPFPARMAPEIAFRSLQQLQKGSVILDPMAGSGTVLRQALDLGHHALGVDVDPLAVLMAKVWGTGINPTDVRKELRLIVRDALDVDLRKDKLPWITGDQETERFIRYWFGDEQRRALQRIAFSLFRRRSSSRISDRRRDALDVLAVSLSRIIITKEPSASLARDTSHSRPHKVVETSDFDVFPAFERSVEFILGRLMTKTSCRAQVERGDARKLPTKSESIDAVITSPPYLNAIDYMRGHRMALVWLGYRLSELRAIRASSIGAERASSNQSKEIDTISHEMTSLRDLPPRLQSITKRYASDLLASMKEVARVLKRNGTATLVVGNSCLRETFVSNSNGVRAAARLCGLKHVHTEERELPTGSRYLPITSHGSLSKRMRTECVMTFRKT